MISTVASYHKPRRYAKATKRSPGKMSKAEQAYQAHLELRKKAGQIREYFYECVNLRLGKNCHYRPDFLVITDDWTMEFHEVKGFKRRPNGAPGFYMEEDAKPKIRSAADKFPFRFVVVCQAPKKDGGYWFEEEF